MEVAMTSHQHTATIAAPADALFAALTDVDRLPDWNDAIIAVTERPPRLEVGAEWVVTMRAMGRQWASRSTLVEHDASARRFRYRSQTDDGSPSWAEWSWDVAPIDATSSSLRVAWSLNPVTFWRRTLLVRIRARQLRRDELPRSLA